MEKLVRDRIPEIIEEDTGEEAGYRIAEREEYSDSYLKNLPRK